VYASPGTPEKSRILKRGPGNSENSGILLVISEKFQNNKQSRSVAHIININEEGRKLIFALPLNELCWKKQQTYGFCWRVVLLLRHDIR